MAVPSSGEISLGKVRQELESTGTGNDYDQGPYTSAETSLSSSSVGIYDTINTGSADRPNASAPFKMSEWHGYDHHAAWNFTWDQSRTHHSYPHVSGSKSSQNTAPNGTVADQILITGSLENYSNAQFTGKSAYDSHQETLVVFWVEESGSFPESVKPVFAVARANDPGVDGTDSKGSGWITGSTSPGRHPSVFGLRSAGVSAANATYYLRIAASGSATTTPGTSFERKLWVGNGQYSSSMIFTTHGVS